MRRNEDVGINFHTWRPEAGVELDPKGKRGHAEQRGLTGKETWLSVQALHLPFLISKMGAIICSSQGKHTDQMISLKDVEENSENTLCAGMP